mmetsp:Transcript_34959/g.100676  ORF Transcript_34959/g.100676 Transcript_34959/m.100676 type:complete len:470 (-) Transcript_34959:19-1428(-)
MSAAKMKRFVAQPKAHKEGGEQTPVQWIEDRIMLSERRFAEKQSTLESRIKMLSDTMSSRFSALEQGIQEGKVQERKADKDDSINNVMSRLTEQIQTQVMDRRMASLEPVLGRVRALQSKLDALEARGDMQARTAKTTYEVSEALSHKFDLLEEAVQRVEQMGASIAGQLCEVEQEVQRVEKLTAGMSGQMRDVEQEVHRHGEVIETTRQRLMQLENDSLQSDAHIRRALSSTQLQVSAQQAVAEARSQEVAGIEAKLSQQMCEMRVDLAAHSDFLANLDMLRRELEEVAGIEAKLSQQMCEMRVDLAAHSDFLANLDMLRRELEEVVARIGARLSQQMCETDVGLERTSCVEASVEEVLASTPDVHRARDLALLTELQRTLYALEKGIARPAAAADSGVGARPHDVVLEAATLPATAAGDASGPPHSAWLGPQPAAAPTPRPLSAFLHEGKDFRATPLGCRTASSPTL